MITVLESFPAPRATTNPYVVMVLESLEATPGLSVRTFSWPAALLGRYDVFHVHWPEVLVTGRSPGKGLVRRLLLSLLLLRLWVSRRPIVRTLHNLGAHEGRPAVDRLLLQLVDRLTAVWIEINPVSQLDEGEASVRILHGHYRDWFARHQRGPSIPGHIAYVGLVRRYKNVEGLIRAFRDIAPETDRSVSLTVAGKPDSDELARAVTEAAAGDSRVDLDLRYLDEEELVATVAKAEVVVLPYHEMYNSGSVLAALSLDRPVLVPANEANARLSREVGDEWVHTYEGDLTGQDLLDVLSRLRSSRPATPPDLSRREWVAAGEQHRLAFVAALHSGGPRSTPEGAPDRPAARGPSS